MTLLTEGTEDGQIHRQAAEQRLPGAGSRDRKYCLVGPGLLLLLLLSRFSRVQLCVTP